MKKLKKYIESLNLNVKKEISLMIIAIAICILSAVVLYLKDFKNLALVTLFIPPIIIFIQIIRYSMIKDKIINEHEDEFIVLINYLEIFISNKFNVYNSFIQVKQYCSLWMRERIDNLLKDIDDDKSVDPFIKFAKNFKRPITENVMIAIYQLMEEGDHANQLNHFDILFQKISENHQTRLVEKKARQVDSLATLPLVAAGMVIIILTFGIVTIMGEIIDVI